MYLAYIFEMGAVIDHRTLRNATQRNGKARPKVVNFRNFETTTKSVGKAILNDQNCIKYRKQRDDSVSSSIIC